MRTFLLAVTGTIVLLAAARAAGHGEIALAAAVLCAAVTAISLLVTELAARLRPVQRAVAAFAMIGPRMGLALAGGAVFTKIAQFRARDTLAFWAWVITFYVFNLICEVVHAAGRPTVPPSGDSLSRKGD